MTVKKYWKGAPVEAMRWDGTAGGATPIIDWILAAGGTATYRCDFLDHDGKCPGVESAHSIAITTGMDTAAAGPGWWIYRDRSGFRPCLNDIFQANFKEVI